MDHYRIPSSTITLELNFRQAEAISPSDVDACLSNAFEQVRQKDQSALVEGVQRLLAPSPANLETSISGSIYANELTWADAATVLHSLQGFFAERQRYFALLIYVQDEQRGALGSVDLDRPQAVTLQTAVQDNPTNKQFSRQINARA